MIRMLYDDRQQHIYELPFHSLTWRTQRIGKASSINFTYPGGDTPEGQIEPVNGGIIRLEQSGMPFFHGFNFTIDPNTDESSAVLSYDQIRYMMYQDVQVFEGMTATQILRKLAGDYGLRLGKVADTGYVIKALVCDNKSLLDMVYEALEITSAATGKVYCLWDDAGFLCLDELTDLRTDLVIGDASLLTDAAYRKSIDGDTYNRIRLIREDQKTGKRWPYEVSDPNNIARWGRLQFFETSSDLNDAQMQQKADTLLALHNREKRTLRLTAIGDITCRAGRSIYVEIKSLGIADYYVIESATHTINDGDHTMTLDMKVV